MKTHKCPVCEHEGECIVEVDPTLPHKCSGCGTEWMMNEKGEVLIVE